MKANEFVAGYFASAKNESEVKALWSELMNVSVDAMNKRVDEFKNPGKALLKAAAKKAGQEKAVETALTSGKLVVGGVPKKTADLAEEKIDSRRNKKAAKEKTADEKEEKKIEVKAEKRKANAKGAETKEAYSMKVVKLTAAERNAVKKANLQFVDYSDKAFAFIGDTKPVADIMRKLNGRFNHGLSCGAGWVFAKANKDAVFKSLGV
ncbi:MAG: hypothetical protein MR717_09025 [Prevotella sp.]|nr:hypothetical protein [Prevotella sp.]